MWRVVGVLLALIVALSVVGLVLRALRWLLVVALVLAVAAAVVASSTGRR
ncbi:MAG: hypothetical protein M3N25_09435 [Actinomycetota bacterium]|nr:hypothetical protein [Actinomycetota bacterium]MDP9021006.1 hypothetical protein [Actinomycetota bacterium]